MGKFEVSAGKWFVDEDKDKGMATSEDMRFHSISAKMPKVASSKGKELVLQFSAKYENHQYAFCGGGYIKLMPELNQAPFGGDDEYHVMFGPDLCGYDISHVHAIFNNKGENLLKTDKVNLEYSDKNEFTHLYTMHIKPDGEYEIFFDLESKAKGKIVEDWGFPKPMIDDPSDSKPSDWVDEQEIDDPAAKKPDGYDDIPAQIPDPDATKPEDWDDEDVQLAAYEKMTYIGFELWVVNNGTIFDNILVTDDIEYAKAQGEKLFKPTKDGEKEKKEAWDKENKPADEPMPDDEEGEGEGGGDDEEEKDEL